MAVAASNFFFPPFDCSGPETAVRWTKYVTHYKRGMQGYDVDNPVRLISLLLHFGGDDLQDIYDNLPEADKQPVEAAGSVPAQDVFVRGVAALTQYFSPQQNTEFQKFEFQHTKQLPTENLDKFSIRLRTLAATCDFHDVDREIKSQVISGCRSKRVRGKGLSEPTWSLKQLLDYGRVQELSDGQAKDMERVSAGQAQASASQVQAVHTKPKKRHQKPAWQNKKPSPASDKACGNCGNQGHAAYSPKCPAMGKNCSKCGKLNHFADMCRSEPKQPKGQSQKKQQRQSRQNGKDKADVVADEVQGHTSDEDSDYSWAASQSHDTDRPVFVVGVNGQNFQLLADSGATVNILTQEDYEKLLHRPTLMPHNRKVFGYGGKVALCVKGKFTAKLSAAANNHVSTVEESIIVVAAPGIKSLLSWATSRRLGLIDLVKSCETKDTVQSLIQEFQDIFQGVGKLKGVKVKLHIDDTVPPVVQNQVRAPFHVRKDVEEQLAKDEERDIIESPVGPTPWVSPIVVVPKSTPVKVRVCVDMRAANMAIKREHHPSPTLDDLVYKLNGAKVFSKIDLRQGYNQLELDEESRYITTFATHKGLRRYKRLFFGINSAAEVFQNEIRKALSGLDGVENISDDTIVFAKDDDDHMRILRSLFTRIRDRGLTLNGEKCEFEKPSIEFFGHVFSGDGVRPSPTKVQSIQDMGAPQNASEVRSLLGMANYCGQRFIKDYSTLTHNLRELTKADAPWTWEDKHQRSLDRLKEALANTTALQYFDPRKESEVYVDASPVGICAILMQKEPDSEIRYNVHFASRALTPTEQRYSQIEREALAVVWGCEHLNMYLYGSQFTVITDHKPLLSLLNNARSKPSARIQGWALRLQPYTFNLIYKPGKSNPADYLSRHLPVGGKTLESSREQRLAESIVNYISVTSMPKPLPVEDVRSATLADETLQAVMSALRDNKWYKHQMNPGVDQLTFNSCYRLKDELSASQDSDLLLRGTRIVIPSTLQQHVVNLAHVGHQGLVKTKALLREKVWFCGIDRLTDETVRLCMSCQLAVHKPQREPLKMSALPRAPWVELSMDFGQLPNGQYLMVLTDDYSRYPFVEVINSTSAKTVIPRLDSILAMRGIPEIIRTDNGPPFNGEDFRLYAERTGFKHRKITPLWPRANGEVERFMGTVKKTVKVTIAQHGDWQQELRNFLLAYRVAPATLLFGQPIHTYLPEIGRKNNDTEVRVKDASSKLKMKCNHDQKRYVKPIHLEVGDDVIVQDDTIKRSVPPYKPQILQVVRKKGSLVVAESDNYTITRNVSHFKKVNPKIEPIDIPSDSEEEEELPTVPEEPLTSTDVPPTPQAPPQIDIPSPRASRQTSTPRPTRARKAPSHLKDYVLK